MTQCHGSVSFDSFELLQSATSMHPQAYLGPHHRFERSFTSPELSLHLSLNGYFPEEDSSISEAQTGADMPTDALEPRY